MVNHLIQTKTIEIMFKRPDALDEKYKPLILQWLSKTFTGNPFFHAFSDQWIKWNIWDGVLTVSFDNKVDSHNALKKLIPSQYMGTPQHRTMKIVNKDTFYLRLNVILDLKYPEIISSKLINKDKHKGDDGYTFYTYDWEVFLSDGTSIAYRNQVNKMNMLKSSFTYNCHIQTRAFLEFLERFNKE